MDTDVADLVLAQVLAQVTEGRTQSTSCCPECGSFLDAPRVDPQTGKLGRKCIACFAWHPVVEPATAHTE